MCKSEQNVIVTFRAKYPFSSGMQKHSPSYVLTFLLDKYSLMLFSSQLLPQLFLRFTTHIDGNRRQMLCKFEEILIVTFRAKYPFFLGTAADAKAQPLVMTYLLIRRVLIDSAFI